MQFSHIINALFNQSCLHNETLVKMLDTKAQWSFWVCKHTDVLGRQSAQIPQGEGWETVFPSFRQALSYTSLHFTVPNLYPL